MCVRVYVCVRLRACCAPLTVCVLLDNASASTEQPILKCPRFPSAFARLYTKHSLFLNTLCLEGKQGDKKSGNLQPTQNCD
jgi:hypothetical protein